MLEAKVSVSTPNGHGRIARGHGTIRFGKERPSSREPFQIRCLNRVIVVEQRRPVVHVIKGDEQDVGRIGIRRPDGARWLARLC